MTGGWRATCVAMVFWGTLFPVFSELFVGRRIAVGPKYFNLLGGMLAIPLLLLTGLGPLIAWRKASVSNLRNQFTWPVVVGVITAAVVWTVVGDRLTLYALSMWSLCAFVTATIVQEYARAIRARVRKGEESALQGKRSPSPQGTPKDLGASQRPQPLPKPIPRPRISRAPWRRNTSPSSPFQTNWATRRRRFCRK